MTPNGSLYKYVIQLFGLKVLYCPLGQYNSENGVIHDSKSDIVAFILFNNFNILYINFNIIHSNVYY